jgi:hypothetical protein
MVELRNPRANWSQIIESTQKAAEAAATKSVDPVVILEKAALIATAMLERQITAHDVSLMSMAIALAKVSEGMGNQDHYREVISTAACSGHLVGMPTKSLSELRVMTDLANQAANITA